MSAWCVIVDLTNSKYFNPSNNVSISEDALFRFIIKSDDIYDLEEKIFTDFKYAFRIAWLYPYKLWDGGLKNDNVYFIYWAYLWEKYFLNKDPIREKHIWKDVDRWKRAKNYNDIGKDPWTVRLKLIDDWKWKVIDQSYYKPEEVFERIKKCTYKQSDVAYLFSNNYKSIDGFEVWNI